MGAGFNIMKITFGFSRPKSFNILSEMIRSIDKTEFSHSYVRFTDSMNQELVFQASGLAVNLCSFSRFSSIEMLIEEYEMDITNTQYYTTWNFMVNSLGIPYSLVQLLRILAKKITGKEFGHDNGNSEICSQLAATLCQLLGIQINEDLDYTDPSALQKICASNMKRTL